MKAKSMPQKRFDRRGRWTLALMPVALIGAMSFQIIGILVVAAMHLTQSKLLAVTMNEGFAAVGMVLAMLALGGAAWLRSSREDLSSMSRFVWPIIAADVAIVACFSVSGVLGGASICPDWVSNLAFTGLLCVGIGVFEELMFRGVILNGFLAVMGKNHRGTMAAVFLTSLWFGLSHVNFVKDFADPFLAAQGVLKVVQCGLFSIIICSVVMRTHRLGAACLFHGLNDFLLMVPSLVLAGDAPEVSYVRTGDEGMAGIIVYLVVIAFYLPFAIKGLRAMHRDRLAYRGAFMERAAQKHLDRFMGAEGVPEALPEVA